MKVGGWWVKVEGEGKGRKGSKVERGAVSNLGTRPAVTGKRCQSHLMAGARAPKFGALYNHNRRATFDGETSFSER